MTHETIDLGTKASALLEGSQGVIITDCGDQNARTRQQLRFGSLFGVRPEFIGLGPDNPDLEAAGQLVDVLDAVSTPVAYPSTPIAVLVNVAPRGDDIRSKWENGTPFCYFHYDIATVLAPYEGRALSLAHKLGMVSIVNLLDVPQVTRHLTAEDILSAREAENINNTQFRSLEFLPLVARELLGGRFIPAEQIELVGPQNVGAQVWFVDSFGNVKTTLLSGDVDFEAGKKVIINNREVTCYERLTDVPTSEFGLTIGSSGYGDKRFLEVVKQKGRAADEFGLSIGDEVLISASFGLESVNG